MAVVFIRSLLFPRQRDNRPTYSPLPSSRDSTRSSSTSGASSDRDERHAAWLERGDESAFTEKTTAPSTREASLWEGARLNPRLISDATIGLSDGLTVPFALTAGLSALGNTNVVIYGGLAELIAGGISMGLGGYLGAKSEAEGYHASLCETKALVARADHERAAAMVRETFKEYDFAEDTLRSMLASLSASPDQLVDFLMRFHHQLTEADYAPSRAYVSGVTISVGYICGGLVALFPYLFFSTIDSAFKASVIVMALALFVFGWAKTALVGETCRWTCFVNGVQMTLLGGVAAGAAMGCVKAVGE